MVRDRSRVIISRLCVCVFGVVGWSRVCVCVAGRLPEE